VLFQLERPIIRVTTAADTMTVVGKRIEKGTVSGGDCSHKSGDCYEQTIPQGNLGTRFKSKALILTD
jgi:hypothetical protein